MQRKKWDIGAVCFVFLFISVCYWFGPESVKAEEKTSQSSDYIIGLGDIIEVQVWQEPDLSRTSKVRLDGKISLPLIGDVMAAKTTTSALDQLLEKKFSEVITEPAVSVILVESRSRRYYVIGQVSQPGEFAIDYPVTILQAIARSGGFQEWAKKDEIKVVRREGDQETFFRFDYESFVKGNDLDQNIVIAPGDTVIVP